MKTYSDEYLNCFADRYVAMKLDLHGVSLEDYLASPSRYHHLENEFLPPLPKQIEVAKSIISTTGEQ